MPDPFSAVTTIFFDIRGGLPIKPEAIRIDYRISALTVLNNGHTVQANYPKGSRISLGDRSFELLQFHFHTPSEHAINGERFAAEMHLVHKDASGNLAVIGVMIKPGKENLALREVLPHMPRKATAPRKISGAYLQRPRPAAGDRLIPFL